MGDHLELLKKDVHWTISNVNYVVRNVPYTELDAEGDEFYSLGVSIKLTMIRDLMYMNQIPHDVNFDDVADLDV
jgi:hypothetical protein